jgi:peroxiredoxin family protein
VADNKSSAGKATIVVFSGELDKALAAFNIATTSAAMGMDVTMFFTFWGLNVIKRNQGALKSSGWMEKLLNLMNRGGSNRLPMSKFHMLGIGTAMMKSLMRKRRMPSLEEMIATAHQLGVKMMACNTSLGLMALTEDALIPEVDSVVGAATYVNEAKKSELSLFI